jgi:predicted nucleic acid-binding Zn finger protein
MDRKERAKKELHLLEIVDIEDNNTHTLFDVINKKKGSQYRVNLALGNCSCPDNAERGNMCKHVWSVKLMGYEPKYTVEEFPIQDESSREEIKERWRPGKDFAWF